MQTIYSQSRNKNLIKLLLVTNLYFIFLLYNSHFISYFYNFLFYIKLGYCLSALILIDLVLERKVYYLIKRQFYVLFYRFKKNRESKKTAIALQDNSGPLLKSNVSRELPCDDELEYESNNSIVQKSSSVIKRNLGKRHKVTDKKQKTFSNYFELFEKVYQNKRPKFQDNPESSYFDDLRVRIEEKLSEFKIDGQIINILKGPVVDTFELELGTGVKVSKVNSFVPDLSLALKGAPIRIVYPMKGKSTIGIEVPRSPRKLIYLDEIISQKIFRDNKYKLPMAFGKDVYGEIVIKDLAGMPHMLVAGATGAGKSVFINTILMSLLAKCDPNTLKLILIDPKQLELALYANLPHLIMPVITDAKRASISLLWAVQEMERRYTIMKELGVRNIEGYNQKIKSLNKQQLAKIKYLFENEDTFELPYLVIIVDEFADLILTKSGKEIENNICRLAAKARASGVHLIIATQRPSVDVITGLIKSNFPSRVSFRVTSPVDSRTILNSVGAEKLLGKGDMLLKQGIEMSRVHSAFVEELEIEQLTTKLSELKPEFKESVMDFLEEQGDSISGSENGGLFQGELDELYDSAIKIVSETRSASASMLQRRLKVGYNRAANLIDSMEKQGVIGPSQGAKPREVLLPPKE